MSGKGRGRGRGGIPINYPDGLTAKQVSKSPFPDLKPAVGLQAQGGGLLPTPPVLSAEDKEALRIRHEMQQSASFAVFRVGPKPPESEFERYSDRYRHVPRQQFAKSPAFCLREGVHFYSELKSTIAKPKAGKSKRRIRENLALAEAQDLDDGDGEEGEEGEEPENKDRSGREEGEGEGGREDAAPFGG